MSGRPDSPGVEDLYAAVRRDLLHLRGERITVCSGESCVKATVIDCNCGESANVVDLYADAFDNLAPLERGRVDVVILLP